MRGRRTALAALAVALVIAGWPKAAAPTDDIASAPTNRPSPSIVASATAGFVDHQAHTHRAVRANSRVRQCSERGHGDRYRAVDHGRRHDPGRSWLRLGAGAVHRHRHARGRRPGQLGGHGRERPTPRGHAGRAREGRSGTDSFDRLLRYIWVGTGREWVAACQLGADSSRLCGCRDVSTRRSIRRAVPGGRADGSVKDAWNLGPTAGARAYHRNRPTNLRSRMRPRTAIHPTIRACRSSPTSTALTCARWGPILLRVIGPDDSRLDGDHDGIGCE